MIKGLAKRPSFPRIGVLRKGARKTEANKPGRDLDHFRFVSEDPEAHTAFYAAYPPEPRRINIYLPFATAEENLDAWMEEWGAGSLKHRCDGETCVLWQDRDGEYHTAPPEEALPCPGGCKPTGKLMVIVPELQRLAYVQVLTTSWWDCQELSANLAAAEDAARHMGRDLRGIPFVLTRVAREISTPPRERGGKRLRATKWLLHVEPAPTWVALQIEAARRMALPMLEAPSPREDRPEWLDEDEEIVEHEEPARDVVQEAVTRRTEPANGKAASETPAGEKKIFTRADFIARIRALEQEASDLGEPVRTDEAVLDEATPDELKRIGHELRARVDALWAGQAEQVQLI